MGRMPKPLSPASDGGGAARLYESPYTDLNPQGVDGVLSTQQVDDLIAILEDVRKRAIA
jgi:type I restriction enzyme R subunit